MKINVIKSTSLENEFLKKAQIIFYDSKNNPTKGVKSFFPKEFLKNINEDEKTP